MTKNITIAGLIVLCIIAFTFAGYQHAEAEYQHEQAVLAEQEAIKQRTWSFICCSYSPRSIV